MDALTGKKAVIAKLGMDAHWRGAVMVAHTLRDAGMEVVYLGHATPAQIASAVQQEGAELLGLSSLSGNHLTECPEILKALEALGLTETVVVLGGAVPKRDELELEGIGIAACFGVGKPLGDICTRIAELLD